MTKSDPAKLVVVGAGHLGRYHIQKLVASPNADLVGIVDIDPHRREVMALEFGVATHPSVEHFEGLAAGAIIASPTVTHCDLAKAAMHAGMHVLVEKPLAPSLADAMDLRKEARALGKFVQVGHTERFNPAVAAALAIADRPRFIATERLGPFSGRSTDVDVVLDLMIHDLDIVAALVASPLREVRAVGVPVLTTAVDMASARLEFEDGTVAQLTSGRASLEPVRKIRLFTEERYVSVDCARREVKSVRRLPPLEGEAWPQIQAEPIAVEDGDALALQDEHFVRCIQQNVEPRVGADAGVRAIELAEAVREVLQVPHAKSS